ncbi:hypothetical protein Taro_045419 [Colocasia esculenta]|uniref:Uncharacterized protein n=1 Tax=Colocasia esculenta TaxID=4460 RepID=A0A843WPE6_COLES|nr:hypothetical protein [Colocasia esculenta]
MCEKIQQHLPLLIAKEGRSRYSSTMMETAPKRGVSRIRHHPNGTLYQFPRLAYEGIDKHRDQNKCVPTRELMSTETKNSPVDDPTMFESRNSGIDIILSNSRSHRVSFPGELAAGCSACMSRQQTVRPA